MYLSHVSLSRAAIGKRNVQAALSRGAYGHHQLLCTLFDCARNGNFLFRSLEDEAGMHFLTLSRSEPNATEFGDWVVSAKPFHPILSQGQRLMFSVRINPTISRSQSGPKSGSPQRRGKRRDMVYEEVRAHRREHGKAPDRRAVAQECGEQWLGGRLERAGFVMDGQHPDGGASLSRAQVACTGYRQHHVRKGKQTITISTLDCQGVGTVTDPGAFEALLANGLGPAKGFGCGLILIKPA